MCREDSTGDWTLRGAHAAPRGELAATGRTTGDTGQDVESGRRGYVDGGLWTSDLGLLYMEAQREAVKRGVQIRRIFVLDRPDISPAADFDDIVRQHIAIGVPPEAHAKLRAKWNLGEEAGGYNPRTRAETFNV